MRYSLMKAKEKGPRAKVPAYCNAIKKSWKQSHKFECILYVGRNEEMILEVLCGATVED